MHWEFSVLFRVISSSSVIQVKKLDTSLTNLYSLILETSPWVRVSESLHGFCGHGAEMCERNDNRGLLTLSEQPSEGAAVLNRTTVTFIYFNQNLLKSGDQMVHWSEAFVTIYSIRSKL